MVFCCKNFVGAFSDPSRNISDLFGFKSSFLRAVRIATCTAFTIPILSISLALTEEIAKNTSPLRRALWSFLDQCSLFCRLNFFESVIPRKKCISKPLFTAKTQTVTGPAKGPRPTSSTPTLIILGIFPL